MTQQYGRLIIHVLKCLYYKQEQNWLQAETRLQLIHLNSIQVNPNILLLQQMNMEA